MESPDFFGQLRADVLALKTTWPGTLVSASHTEYSRPEGRAGCAIPATASVSIEQVDDRSTRLGELMTQAIFGADIAIRRGSTAAEVWIPLIVDYGKTAPGSRKLTVGITGERFDRDRSGNVIADYSSMSTQIDDLFGLAADYLEHLKTNALAQRQRAEPHQAPARTEQSSNDGGTEQSRAMARCAFVNPRLTKLKLSILEWAQQSVPPVAYNTVRGYLDGKTRGLRANTRTVLAKTLRVRPHKLPQ